MDVTSNGRTETSLGTLVAGVTEDLSSLVRDEIALAKSELRSTTQTAARSGALIGAAALLAMIGVIFVFVTAAYGLVAAGLPTWAGFGIVALVLLVVGAILGYVGARRLRSLKGPERAVEQAKQTRQMLADVRRPAGG